MPLKGLTQMLMCDPGGGCWQRHQTYVSIRPEDVGDCSKTSYTRIQSVPDVV
jgi:hypothetical protein